jgi:hypothetical protein
MSPPIMSLFYLNHVGPRAPGLQPTFVLLLSNHFGPEGPKVCSDHFSFAVESCCLGGLKVSFQHVVFV